MRPFLKQVFASCLGTLLGFAVVGGLGIGGLIALIVVAISLGDTTPGLKDRSFLIINLNTPITDTPNEDPLARWNNETNGVGLRAILEAIARAAKDDKVVGIFLDGRQGDSPNGYATLREVRQALADFQKSGKPVIAYDLTAGEQDYYLASVAQKIWLNPMGEMEWNGLSSEQMFLAGALEKYGVGVQVVRVGRYKSAVEPLIRKDFSPDDRQQTQTWLNGLWGEVVNAIAQSRKLPPEQLQILASQRAILLPAIAQQNKLIDQALYWDQALGELKKISQTPADQDLPQVDLLQYIKEAKTTTKGDRQVAVVYAEGTIVNGEGDSQSIGGDRLARTLRQIRNDDQVKALVLRINSPGGSATASEIILRELSLFPEEKPVIVSMGNVAASGGYWIAMAGDRIFAEPNTITGSIGVFGLLTNIQKLGNNNGITWDEVKTNTMANIGSGSRPKTAAELQVFQGSVNQIYQLFLRKVSTNRRLSVAQVNDLAQGRVWTGRDALSRKLIDQLGGLPEAIAYAAQTANLGEDWRVVDYSSKPSFEEALQQFLDNAKVQKRSQIAGPLAPALRSLEHTWGQVQQFNDPRQVYSFFSYGGHPH